MTSNPVGWFEIYVQDMERARTFYETVFETRLQRLETTGIEMWAFPMEPEGRRTSGSLVHAPGIASGGNGTLVYFNCQDCASQAGRIERAGGRLERAKLAIGRYGFVALGIDTEGNRFGMHSTS